MRFKLILGLLTILIVLFLLISSIRAETDGFILSKCINDSYVQKNVSWDGKVFEGPYKYCENGCYNNINEDGDDCAPNSYWVPIYVLIIFLVFIGVFIFIYTYINV